MQFAAAHGRKWDGESRASPGPSTGAGTAQRQRYGCVSPWRELYYDDASALGLKYDLINHYNLRGAGIWALGYDGTRPELQATLKAKFITDKVPPVISGSSLSNAFVSPNAHGDGRLDTVTTIRVAATGLIRYGWYGAADRERARRAARSGREASTRAGHRHIHLGRQGQQRPDRPRRVVPDHGLDRGRIEQPCRGHQGRHRRPPSRRRHRAILVELHLAKR